MEDSNAATASRLKRPMGLAMDSLDNLYIADHIANQVRMVDSNGVIYTIAGLSTGFSTFNSPCSGDGGFAQAAELRPLSVAFSATGEFATLFIADGFNSNVRGVKMFASTPTALPTPLPADSGGSSGTIYTLTGLGQSSYRYGAPAEQLSLNTEYGIALDPTNTYLYVYSTSYCVVQRISLISYIVERVVGNTETCSSDISLTPLPRLVAGMWVYALLVNINQGSSLAFGSNAMLYIASRFSNCVYVYNPGTKFIMLLVGPSATPAGSPWATGNYFGDGSVSYGGTAAQTRLNYPRQMAFDDANNILYICDSGNNLVRKVSLPVDSTPLPNTPNVSAHLFTTNAYPLYYLNLLSLPLFVLVADNNLNICGQSRSVSIYS